MTTTFNEPLKPDWPMNVLVFKPTDNVEDIKKRISPTEDPITKYTDENGVAKETYNSKHHFSTKHYALLFSPGEYKDCQFEVGYYVQMAGLGKTAKGEDAVRFTGPESGPFVPALRKNEVNVPWGLCLDTFWRSAENYSAENTQWAVSQAAPLRRVHISNQLMFGDGAAYSSGGFVANAEVGGETHYAANQQWISRGCDLKGKISGGAWSTVFSGCTPGPNLPIRNKTVGQLAVTIEDKPEARVEKPYIVMNSDDEFELHIPNSTTEATVGAHLDGSNTEVRSFSQVKVCKPILPLDGKGNYVDHDDATYNAITQADEDLTKELQDALDEGKDLLLCPGLFFLTKPLIIKKPNQVIIGIGLPTLVAPQDGSPCIRVLAKTPGVRIAALVLEGSKQVESADTSGLNSDGVRSLLDFGEPDVTDDAGDINNPGLISDVFTRVGGSNPERTTVSTDVMIRIHSGNVVGDNLWLWRADHVKLNPGEKPNFPKLDYHQVRIWGESDKHGNKEKVDECVVKNALVVTGDDVKIYGLFCEHTTEHQMIWKGERGSVTFFQCELPYDVDESYADNDFTGYFVHEDVNEHTALAIGVYCNFQKFNVNPKRGISLPSKEGIVLANPFTRFLDNYGGIKNVAEQGGAFAGDAVHGDGSEDDKFSRAWDGEKRVHIM